MDNPKTYLVKAGFYVTSNQFKSVEDLQKFIESCIKDYEGTEYKTVILENGVQVEFRY